MSTENENSLKLLHAQMQASISRIREKVMKRLEEKDINKQFKDNQDAEEYAKPRPGRLGVGASHDSYRQMSREDLLLSKEDQRLKSKILKRRREDTSLFDKNNNLLESEEEESGKGSIVKKPNPLFTGYRFTRKGSNSKNPISPTECENTGKKAKKKQKMIGHAIDLLNIYCVQKPKKNCSLSRKKSHT